MPKKIKLISNSDNIDYEAQTTGLLSEKERLRKQVDELHKEVYRLQLERDILETAAEIIKKARALVSKHLPIEKGPIYLSPIIDCYDGLPVSWTIGTSPDAELVNTMHDQAISVFSRDEHSIIHSDCGCHYRWPFRGPRKRPHPQTANFSLSFTSF